LRGSVGLRFAAIEPAYDIGADGPRRNLRGRFLAFAVRLFVGRADEFAFGEYVSLWRAHHKWSPFLMPLRTDSARRGRKIAMRCHSTFETHSSSAFFQERCVATERTVNFEPLFRA